VRGCVFRIASSAALLWSLTAAAQSAATPYTRSFDAVPDKPTPLLNSGITLEGGELFSPKSFRAALLVDMNGEILALQLGEKKLGNLIPFRADAHALFSYQILQRLEVGVDLPVTFYQQDNTQLLVQQGFATPGISAVGLDELRVLPRFVILDGHRFPIWLDAVGEVRFPTGDRGSFLGSRGLGFAPRITAERAFGRLRLFGDMGYRFRYAGQFLNLYVGNEFNMGVGGAFHLPDIHPGNVTLTHVNVLGEMVLSTPVEAPFTFSQADSLKTPWELLVGLRARWTSRWGAELDLGRGLGTTTGYGREAYRIMLALRYDFEWADRDGDGIPDDIDKCPDEPEDKDGFQDEDGCPDPDNDMDGIPDTEDACPNDPGPKEYDGCPDRDGDTIPDNVDKCPDEPGPAENDGCPISGPAVVLETDRIRLRQNILFETAMAVIKPLSFHILDEVANVLAKHPELKHVEVQGHTDNIGSRPYNLDLSDRRAKSVIEYLSHKGIDRRRLTPHGFGFDKPIAPNTNAIGRARNRRVEFNLEERPKPETPPAGAETGPPPTGPPPTGPPAAEQKK
jgi:OOP family OmpA-OmpF porin